MKRFFIDIFFTAVICIVLLFLLRLFAYFTGLFLPQNVRYIYQVLQSLIFLFGISGVTYKRLWLSSIFKNKVRFAAFILCQSGIAIIIYHLISVHKNAVEYYKYFTADNFISWQGQMFTKDDTLGYRLTKNKHSSLVYNFLPAVPVVTDKEGFHIAHSVSALTDSEKPVDLLFLGCSVTFGSACKAEDTFPFLVAQERKMTYVNAAVSGYGLAQMYLQAKQLIPKLRPKYLIIQYSPWLIARGVSEFAPSRGGYLLPTPYFSDKAAVFQVEPPVYKSSVETLFPAQERKFYKGKFFRYYFEKGVPYFFREQIQLFAARCKNILLIKKRPTGSIAEAESFAYSEIFKLANRYSVKVLLLNFGYAPNSDKCRKTGKLGSNIVAANADSLLYQFLGTDSELAYHKMFCHWGKSGKDSVFVDNHPNPLSHRLIAKSILMHLK